MSLTTFDNVEAQHRRREERDRRIAAMEALSGSLMSSTRIALSESAGFPDAAYSDHEDDYGGGGGGRLGGGESASVALGPAGGAR